MADQPERAVLWSAVSTEEQARADLPSLDEQERMCREHCVREGDIIVATLRAAGFSRFVDWLPEMMERCPDYAELVRLMRSGTITKIVTPYYHRLWRTAALQTQVCALADSLDIWLYSVSEPIGRGAEQTAMWVHGVSGMTAEQGVRDLVDNHRRGLRGRVNSGRCTCHNRRPYGYNIVGSQHDRRLVVNEAERPGVQYLMGRRAEGIGCQVISNEMFERGYLNPNRPDGRWTRQTINYICHNPLYAGYVRLVEYPRRPKSPKRTSQRVVHIGRGQHEPIISEELWQRIQRINESNARNYARKERRSPHLFSGLCKCGFCGGGMCYGWVGRNKTERLSCSLYRRIGHPKSEKYPHSCYCNMHTEHKLRAIVIAYLRMVMEDPEQWARTRETTDQRAQVQQRVDVLEREIAQIRRRRTNIMDAIEITESRTDREVLMERFEQWGETLAQREEELAALHAQHGRIEETKARLTAWRDVAEDLEHWPDEKLRPLLMQLIDRIVLMRGKPPEIYLVGE